MSRPTVEKCTNGNVRLIHTGRYGDETRMTMTPEDAAILVGQLLEALGVNVTAGATR